MYVMRKEVFPYGLLLREGAGGVVAVLYACARRAGIWNCVPRAESRGRRHKTNVAATRLSHDGVQVPPLT